MKIIKIFLASSEELAPEREKMTALIYHLNKLFKSRRLELDLERWEYIDASMSNQRKQDEYNDVLRHCDVCMVLFWRKLGGFTREELDIAYHQMKNGEKPQKIYVFFKKPDDDDVSREMKDFIQEYEQRYGGHFFCKFQNADEMNLEFLLQFLLYQKDQIGENAVEVRQGCVLFDGEAVADLNNIPFVANNAGFRKMKAELIELREEISNMQAMLEKKRQKQERKKAKLEKDPDDVDYQEEYQEIKEEVEELMDKLQKKLDRKNKLEKDLENELQSLFNTARRITEMRADKITERMTRAIEAFYGGDAQRADAILDKAEHDADEALSDIRLAKQVGLKSLEELILKASVKMDNDSIPIEKRIDATKAIYEKADVLAKEVDYEKEKYVSLLRIYAEFLKKRDLKKAIDLFIRHDKMLEEIYGPNNIYMAMSYDDIAGVYIELGGDSNWDIAWSYLEKAITIQELNFGPNHPDVANTYLLMGQLQIKRLNYQESKKCLEKAVKIFEEAGDTGSMGLALTYRELGRLYERCYKKDKELASYQASLNYHSQVIKVLKNVAGEENEHVLYTYNNLAILYSDHGEYDKALELHNKSLTIKEKIFGFYHLSTAIEYNNVGNVYHDQTNYEKAMDCYSKALEIKKKILTEGDYSFSNTYKRMGITSMAMGNYPDAEKYLSDALEIRRHQLKEGDERIVELEDELAKCKMRPKN